VRTPYPFLAGIARPRRSAFAEPNDRWSNHGHRRRRQQVFPTNSMAQRQVEAIPHRRKDVPDSFDPRSRLTKADVIHPPLSFALKVAQQFKLYEVLTRLGRCFPTGASMLPARPHIPQEEHCPVSEVVLGQLYRASAHGLHELVAAVPGETRAMLALYCYRRAHLQSIGLAIATGCGERELERFGGNAGKVLFENSRKIPNDIPTTHYRERRKITLSSGILKEVVQDEDDLTV
jgi:hypothetical protein